MTCSTRALRALAIVSFSSIISACGGGGGGSSLAPDTSSKPPTAVLAPTITIQPQPQVVVAGTDAVFSVTATSSAPLTYQWQRNGIDIVGAVNASYTLTAAQLLNNKDQYSVTASNSAASINSAPATLTVDPSPGVNLFSGKLGGSGSLNGTGTATRFAFPVAMTTDASNNIYIVDQSDNSVRKLSAAGVLTTFVGGSVYLSGDTDGTGRSARFAQPTGAAMDSAGNMYVTDTANSTIRKIAPSGVVTTFAGLAGANGYADGTGNAARFSFPGEIAVDSTDNLYVTEAVNKTVRKITPGGVVTTLAGSPGITGSADGAASAALFDFSIFSGIAVDSQGNVFVADTNNSTIRKITAAGVVTTFAGAAGFYGYANGNGNSARFFEPSGLATDPADNIYVADEANSIVRKISPTGAVTNFVGKPMTPGAADGLGNSALFNNPLGVVVDRSGNILIADSWNYSLRKSTAGGLVSTLAGVSANRGHVDENALLTRFDTPTGVCSDANGNSYVLDYLYRVVRKLSPAGSTTTLAGLAGHQGFSDGMGDAALFNFDYDSSCVVDSSGNIYLTDTQNNAIRKITPAGRVTTVAGGTVAGSTDGTGATAQFHSPSGIAIDSSKNLYVADFWNAAIRKITTAGVVTTLPVTLGQPTALVADSADNLYVTDNINASVIKITPAMVVTTLAGGLTFGSADGMGSTASFGGLFGMKGITVDANGNLYVADTTNASIRKISPNGVVTTVAGVTGRMGVMPGPTGTLNRPTSIAIFKGSSSGAATNLIVTDYAENCVLLISIP